MNKNNLVIILLAAVLLTACGNTSSATEPAIDTTISSVTETEETSTDDVSESILFYGDYVLDGTCSDQSYYDRIIFYPDGKCYAHLVSVGSDNRGFFAYEYSFSAQSNKICFGSLGGGNGYMLEVPVMSENKTLLKFDNYVLKRADE